MATFVNTYLIYQIAILWFSICTFCVLNVQCVTIENFNGKIICSTNSVYPITETPPPAIPFEFFLQKLSFVAARQLQFLVSGGGGFIAREPILGHNVGNYCLFKKLKY